MRVSNLRGERQRVLQDMDAARIGMFVHGCYETRGNHARQGDDVGFAGRELDVLVGHRPTGSEELGVLVALLSDGRQRTNLYQNHQTSNYLSTHCSLPLGARIVLYIP
jgi:hypothetical protein